MKKRKFATILLVILFTFLPALVRAEPLKIGFILSMTGSWAEFGEAQKNALELARSDKPNLFRNIKFIYEDCGYSSKNAVTAFNKLKNLDKVDALFVWGVEPSLALAPLAETYELPLFVSALDPRAAIGRKYVIRTINYALQHSEKMSEYLRAKGFRNLAVVKAELSFFNVLIDGLRANIDPDESLEIVESFLPNQVDFRSVISKLKLKKYDALGLYLVPAQVIQFFRQARELNYVVPSFGTTTFQSKTVIADAAGEMTGAVFAHNFVEGEFRRRYEKRYGDDIQIPWAANAYDFAILLGTLFGDVKKPPSPQNILESVSTIAPQEGVGGKYRFVASEKLGRFFEYPVAVYQITESDYSVISR